MVYGMDPTRGSVRPMALSILQVLCLFSKGVGVKDFNEDKALSILKPFRIFFLILSWEFVVENDSFNVIFRVSHDICKP